MLKPPTLELTFLNNMFYKKGDLVFYEWSPKNKNYKNYGDAMSSILAQIAYNNVEKESNIAHFFIGSVLQNEVISLSLKNGFTPYFYGCGHLGLDLEPDLVKKIKVFGVRGKKTKDILKKSRYSDKIEISGDSAYYLFKKIQISKTAELGESLMFHIEDPNVDVANTNNTGKHVISPKVFNNLDILNISQQIKNSSFLISGSMHGCIAAHALNIPFCPMDNFIWNTHDFHKNKWYDWILSIGLDEKDLYFAKNMKEAKEWYFDIKNKLIDPNEIINDNIWESIYK